MATTTDTALPTGRSAAVTQSATNGLARLLATENIRVEHQPVPTAMFDTITRTLVLPIWRGMSDDLYDMLVGHEVGHALWTPSTLSVVDDALTRLKRLGSPNDAHAKAILNIVEDARIERKIKERFPGLRRNFVVAYRDLIARDLFGLSEVGGDPNARGFIDRFNLHHKCAALGLMQVDFTSAERALVNRGCTTESFEDVVCLCEDIVRHLRERGESDADDEGRGAGAGAGAGDADGESMPVTDPGDGQDSAESGAAPSASGATPTSDGESRESVPGSGTGPDGEDSLEKDNGKPQDAAQSQNQNDPGRGRSAADGLEIGKGKITTDSALASGLSKMTDTRNCGYYNQYADAPNFKMDRLLVPAEDVVALWRDEFAKTPAAVPMLDGIHNVWKRDNMPTVLNMVKRFDQRKAADDARRTLTAKTGRIDMNRLAHYRVSEDIFLSMQTLPQGKSHGLVMLVDWSGSMNCVLGSVLSQVLCLVEFCRRTGVPYEVYAFTDCVSGWKQGDAKVRAVYDDGSDEYYSVTDATPGTLDPRGFRMVQFLRSGMTRADHSDAVRGLLAVMALNGYEPFDRHLSDVTGRTAYYRGDGVHNAAPGFAAPAALSLNGTPLNEGLLASADLVEAFRKRTGAQIVSLAVLTDGDASRRIHVKSGKTPSQTAGGALQQRTPAVVLRWGTRQYPFIDTSKGGSWGREEETNAIIRYIRERTGARVYGFFLLPQRNALRAIDQTRFPTPQGQTLAREALERDGSCVMPHRAYDEYYYVGIQQRTVADDFLNDAAAADLSARKIATSFKKGMQSRNTSRTIMVRFTDCFATGKPSQQKMKV